MSLVRILLIQISYYFRCLQSRCHYLDGGCLSSPRWSSLLVAEIYYPDTVLSGADTVNSLEVQCLHLSLRQYKIFR